MPSKWKLESLLNVLRSGKIQIKTVRILSNHPLNKVLFNEHIIVKFGVCLPFY